MSSSDSFREIELGNSSAAPLARTSHESLVELHPGGEIGDGNGAARQNSGAARSTSTTTPPSSPCSTSSSWLKWAADKPHPVCNLAAVALGLLSAILLVTTLVTRAAPPGRGPLLSAGQGCGVVAGKNGANNCSVSNDGSFAPEGGLSSSVSFSETRDFRGKPRSIVVVGRGGGSGNKTTTTASGGTKAVGNDGGGGVVAADHGRCSDLGASFLSRGGNAADAAVATALCQGVYNPMASGIGGGTIIMWRKGKGRKKKKSDGGGSDDEEVIDGREPAPAAASSSMFTGKPASASLDGGLAVAVPMELAALSALFERHGSRRITWSELVTPAARIAREGFEAHPYYVSSVSGPKTLEMLRSSPELREAFLVKGATKGKGGGKETWRPPLVGERCCSRPALAETLEAVAREGARDAFYLSDERSQAIVEDVRAAGGVLSVDDFRNAAPRVAKPLRSFSKGNSKNSTTTKSPLWGMTLLVPPPPSSGASLLLAAAVAAGFEQPLPFGRGLGAHRLVEAMKHGMALRAALGDDGRGDFVSFGGGGSGGRNCSEAVGGRRKERRRRRRQRRSLLAVADAAAASDGECQPLAVPAPIPEGSFEGTSHVRDLLVDAADPTFAASLRSEIKDDATNRDPASYGGKWGLSSSSSGSGKDGRRKLSVSFPPDDHGTSALVVVDADFNAVSLTTTINTAFGSGVYSRKTGVLLNNQMDDFSVAGRSNGYGLKPSETNFIEPGKRPLSSMSPMFLEADEDDADGESDPTFGLRFAAGASGGPRILTALLQTLFNVVEGGDSPLEAVSKPRLHHQLVPGAVFAERWSSGGLTEKVDDVTLSALEKRGHEVKSAGWGAVVQAVVVPAGGGPLEATSDPRKDGAPAAAVV